jgi:two-component system response regulator YesN
MYNLLVVDDEEIVRNGIVDVLVSNVSGFRIMSASNGLEALSIIEKNDIDAMILDIKMPKLDGLGLLKILKEREIKIKTSILSGYEEFEFAKTAIECGVVNYILKPVVPKEIIKYVAELEEELDKEKRQSEELDNLRNQLKENLGLIKEKFFNDILAKRIGSRDFIDRVKFLNLNMYDPWFQVAIIDIVKYYYFTTDEKKQLINYSIHKYLESEISKVEYMEYFQVNSSQFIILFNLKDNQEVETRELLYKLKKKIESKFNVCSVIGVGNKYEFFQNIRRSYFEASNSVKYGVLLGREDIVNIGDIDSTNASLDYLFDFDDFLIKLKLCEVKDIQSQLNEVFDRIDSCEIYKFDIESFNLFCLKLVIYTLTALKEINIDIRSIDLNELNILTEIYHSRSWQDVRDSIFNLINRVAAQIEEHRKLKTRNVIEKAKSIINDNYDKDISVKFIAEKLFLNPTYLGQLFKTETCMTINEYLNRVRINKAKALLKGTDLMIYEIAEKVGFSDSQYFSTVFKKIIGVTPKEYKEI